MAGNKELLARGFTEAFGLIYKPTYLFIRDEGQSLSLSGRALSRQLSLIVMPRRNEGGSYGGK